MDLFLGDLVSSLVQTIRDEIPIKVGSNPVVKSLVPQSLDVVYITDRILACSEPMHAPNPTFNDQGRDFYWDKFSKSKELDETIVAERLKQQQQQQQRQKKQNEEQNEEQNDSQSRQSNEGLNQPLQKSDKENEIETAIAEKAETSNHSETGNNNVETVSDKAKDENSTLASTQLPSKDNNNIDNMEQSISNAEPKTKPNNKPSCINYSDTKLDNQVPSQSTDTTLTGNQKPGTNNNHNNNTTGSVQSTEVGTISSENPQEASLVKSNEGHNNDNTDGQTDTGQQSPTQMENSDPTPNQLPQSCEGDDKITATNNNEDTEIIESNHDFGNNDDNTLNKFASSVAPKNTNVDIVNGTSQPLHNLHNGISTPEQIVPRSSNDEIPTMVTETDIDGRNKNNNTSQQTLPAVVVTTETVENSEVCKDEKESKESSPTVSGSSNKEQEEEAAAAAVAAEAVIATATATDVEHEEAGNGATNIERTVVESVPLSVNNDNHSVGTDVSPLGADGMSVTNIEADDVSIRSDVSHTSLVSASKKDHGTKVKSECAPQQTSSSEQMKDPSHQTSMDNTDDVSDAGSSENDENDDDTASSGSLDSAESDEMSVKAQLAGPEHQPKIAKGNSPAALSTFLNRRHKNHLTVSLSDHCPDDRTLLLFRRQIVQLGWWSPCIQRSETPSILKLLEICYAIHAYLKHDQSNVVMIYCANGKTRTAIAVACYLKYAGLVRKTSDGFLHFLSRRCPTMDATATLRHLPPSLQTFFRQFDDAIEIGFLNQKPLLLRAITLQGVPVEDKPCLEIWDSSGKHVYSSHPNVWDSSVQSGSSQWADEEGFYRVNVSLEGDFLLLCRFGGDFAQETSHDPSKVLFRYANTTAYLSGGGPYELPPAKVDLMRRYAHMLDDDDFLVTLLFQSHWDCTGPESETLRESNGRLPKVFRDQEALEAGWQIIRKYHSAQPNDQDISRFQSVQLSNCPKHLVSIGLQLTNFCYKSTEMLMTTSLFAWWQVKVEEGETSEANSADLDSLQDDKKNAVRQEADAILGILDDVNAGFERNMELNGILDIDLPDEFRTESLLFGDNMEDQSDLSKRRSGWASTVSGSLYDSIQVTSLPNSGLMVPTMMIPHRGDVIGAFGTNQSIGGGIGNDRGGDEHEERKLVMSSMSRPALPILSSALPSEQDIDLDDDSDKYHFHVSKYDQCDQVVTDLHSHVQHTGISHHGLLDLLQDSKRWGKPPISDEPSVASTDKKDDNPDKSAEDPNNMYQSEDVEPGKDPSSMNKEAKETKEKEWEKAKKAEADAKKDVQKQKGQQKDESKAEQRENDSNEEKPPITKEKSEEKKEDRPDDDKKDGEEGKDSGETPLKDDPEYSKYFKMLKMGMAKEQVLHALKRDDKDPIILDLDPNKSMKSQLPEEKPAGGDECPLKDDPEYTKYFKMLSMGLPPDAVKHSIQRDGKDPSILDLDPNKSLKSQMPSDSSGDNDPPLKDDPEYGKYFKMLDMGLPPGAVKNALTRDGKDPGIIDLDRNKSLKSQTKSAGDDGPPLKEDPEYSKYFKMLTMGLPVGAVKNALSRDGKDPGIMDLDPEKSLKSQMGGGDEDTGPPLKDDPEYSKYYKMLTMGLPIGAVKNALSRDGKDPAIMDLDPNKSLKSQMGGAEEKDTGIPLKDDPEYTKYFKMLGMGLPAGAVKNALERDGKNPAVMDLDPNKSVEFQLKKQSSGNKRPAKKKKRVRRKKIYWNPIDPGKLKEDSMWTIVKGSVIMDKLDYDIKEFEDLFTESADPADKKKAKSSGPAKAQKKAVQVIDGKRDMNGGIILKQLKMEHSKIAQIVNKMEHGKFDATQLMGLKEYIPNADERGGLHLYLKKSEGNEEERAKAMADLSETERYMVAMMDVKDAAAKMDAMIFRTVFKTRFEEISASIKTLNTACDEVRSSERLRKLMAMILTVVNQINTGGEGNMALGFTLDALLKLNEAKAFDKKTSVLHYLVKLVKKNDESLLHYSSDLASVGAAENVLLDSLGADIKVISDDLEKIHETVKVEAERLEKAGELKPMSLAELAEQRTSVHHVGFVPQYNKIDHHTGRTPMERFTLSAKVAIQQATESVENVKKKYVKLLEYFGEDEKMASGDFFGTLRRFEAEFKKATEQVEAIEKAAAKEKKKAAAKAKKAAEKAAKAKEKEKGKTEPENAKDSKSEKSVPTNTEKGVKPGDGGGVGAMAAAAAAAAKKSKPEPPAAGGGGIAAMAAAAAAKKSKPAPAAGGGIAAMAAAAAAKKSKPEPGGGGGGGGGIAAMAAAAAAKKSKPEPAAGGGIAAMAAAAAAKKNKAGTPPAASGGGIAAMAAAAAAKKSKPGPAAAAAAAGGGIAAMAAAAAAKKSKTEPPAPAPAAAGGGGGIAAMAAAAAAKKSKPGPPAGSGIAARAAAAAAAKKNRPELSAGGIASSAAAAAAKKSKSKPPTTDGIAAAAAASKKPDASNRFEKPSIGMAKAQTATAGTGSNHPNAVKDAKQQNQIKPSPDVNRTKPDISPIGAGGTQQNATSSQHDQSNGDQTNLQTKEKNDENDNKNSSSDTRNENGIPTQNRSKKVPFAAKAAAYRKRKGLKDEGDTQQSQGDDSWKGEAGKDEPTAKPTMDSSGKSVRQVRQSDKQDDLGDDKPKTTRVEEADVKAETSGAGKHSFLSAAAAYRKKKSSRDLSFDDDDDGAQNDASARSNEKRKSSYSASSSSITGQGKRRKEDLSLEENLADSYTPSQSEKNQLPMPSGSSQLIPMSARPHIMNKIGDSSSSGPLEDNHSMTLSDFLKHKDSTGRGRPGEPSVPMRVTRKEERIVDSLPFGASSPVRGLSRQGGFRSGGFLAKAARSFDQDAYDDDDDMSIANDSVIMVAQNLEKRRMDSRMSETWTTGDTIPNWMGWANQVIKSSDTDSVAGFEASMDLNDMNDFDDDSTVATYADDMTISSTMTPSRTASTVFFDGPVETPGVTPAEVAASILFDESPVDSKSGDPTNPNMVRMREPDLGLDDGLSFGGDRLGLDAGLSFGGGGGTVGLDDGLAFGGDNLDLPRFNSGRASPPDPKKERKWFQWG